MKSQRFCYLWIFLFALVDCYDSRAKHLLVAPVQFISGVSNKVCISRFGSATAGKAVAHVELLTSPKGEDNERNVTFKYKYIARTKKTFSEGNGGCFDIFVPKTNHKKAVLHLKMRFDKLEYYKVNDKRNVDIQHNANIISIVTDKSVYRAGETVKFRIIQLKNDLTPLNMAVYKVFIEAPPDIFSGSIKVVQWYNTSTQLGIMQKEYKIDKYGQQGEWRIVVESRGPNPTMAEQTFLVTEYALPSFNMHVHYKKNLFLSSDTITWDVCILYVHGEAVKGDLFINIKTDNPDSIPLFHEFQLNGSISCINHTVPMSSIFNDSSEYKPRVIIAEIAFQESGLKIWKNFTAVSNTNEKFAKIEFLNKHDTHFKPGLPHEIKTRVKNYNNEPIGNVEVKLCKWIKEVDLNVQKQSENSWNNSNDEFIDSGTLLEECENGITNKKGIVSFFVTVPMHLHIENVFLSGQIENMPSNEKVISTFEYNSTASMKLTSVNLNSRINMEINSFSSLKNPWEIIFPIFFSFPSDDVMKQITLHYLIVTRAGTLYHWGISSQCINPVHNTQNFKEKFSTAYSENECDENYSESNIYKTMLRIKISHLMCPYSYLVIYFMSSTGELIVGSKKFEISRCFSNEISQNWVQNIVSPGSVTNLSLKSLRTVGPTLCLLESTNTALKNISPRKSIHGDLVFKIHEFMVMRSIRNQMLKMELCLGEANNQSPNDESFTKFKNALNLFIEMGLTLITDVTFQQREGCWNIDTNDVHQLEKVNLKPKITPERIFFPETWLWETYLMDSTKVLNVSVTVPDDITMWESNAFCISRSGIAISQPKYLNVFKPLFIDFQTPKTIKRGEEIQMHFKVFNYLNYPISVKTNIDIDPYKVASLIFLKPLKIECIPSKATMNSYFIIIGQELKSFNISIHVHSSKDFNSCINQPNQTYSVTNIDDTIIKEINVEAEGFVVKNQKSALLCLNDTQDEIMTSWDFDKSNYVDGSENIFISLVGDIAGPMKINAGKLITLPMGCGEQNMVLIAYNLMALEYSLSQKRIFGETKDVAVNNLISGYQRQMRFRHSNGAFSAFGNMDDTGSTWLTALCVKYFSILYSKWKIGSYNVIQDGLNWLLSKQLENGCFQKEGPIFHGEMMGGLNSDTSNIALTAYITIALIDAQIDTLKSTTVDNIVFCLGALTYKDKFYDYINSYEDAQYDDPQYVYTLALSTYAILKLEKYSTFNNSTYKVLTKKSNSYLTTGSSGAIDVLKRLAKKNGNLMWWEAGSLATSIETTAYGILSLLEHSDDNVMDAMAAARWLSTHRNPEGGFVSTQDTLIATQALCALRLAIPDIIPSLNIEIESPEERKHVRIIPQERYNLQNVEMKFKKSSNFTRTHLKFTVRGTGCALVQITQKYNTQANVKRNSPFRLYANVMTHGTFSCEPSSLWCKCAAKLELCVDWNDPMHNKFPEMALLEIQLPTGYIPDRYLLYKLIGNENNLLKRIEESQEASTIYMYLSPSSKHLSYHSKECYNIYLIGPKSYTHPAVVKVSDYYNQEIFQSMTFTIPQSCNPNGDLHLEAQGLVHGESAFLNSTFQSSIDFASADEEYEENRNEEDRFANWTTIDSETDLEVPGGNEGPYEVRVPG